jgi:hypothetical protein
MRISVVAAMLVGLVLTAGTPALALMGGGHGGGTLGGMNAAQTRRQVEINECARRYPSYDSLTKTYKGRDGRRHSCFE